MAEEVISISDPNPDEIGAVLLDGRTRAELFPRAQPHFFPLRARHLGESLTRATSRQTLSSPEALIAAAPKYFGDTKY
jgi:hypothetical protein